MYLGLVLIILAVLFAVIGIASGGVFTLVLVPLAVIGAVTAVVALMSARAAGLSQTLTKTPDLRPAEPVPAEEQPPPGETAVTPDEYVEARQRTQ
jgi:hypothetical protein